MDKIMSKPGDHNKELNNLNKLTADLIKRNTPEGLRAVEDSRKHREFIRSLAEAI
jgi:hypothetical protein